MSQEKKNIRILTPQKKTKQPHQFTSGAIGAVIGFSVASIAFYSYQHFQSQPTLVTDSNPPQASQINEQPTPSNQHAVHDENEHQGNDEYQSQTKMKDLNNIFKRQPNITATQVTQETQPKNPFENAFGAEKPSEIANKKVTEAQNAKDVVHPKNEKNKEVKSNDVQASNQNPKNAALNKTSPTDQVEKVVAATDSSDTRTNKE